MGNPAEDGAFETEALARLAASDVPIDHELEPVDITRLTIEHATGIWPGERISRALPWTRYSVSLRATVNWARGSVVRLTYPRYGLDKGEALILKGLTSFGAGSLLSLIGPRYWTDEHGNRTRLLTREHLDKLHRGEKNFRLDE